jgi:hypothetical protein
MNVRCAQDQVFQRQEVNMKAIVEGLRGPAFGAAIVIVILAGTLVTAAFAALAAQIGLFVRNRSRRMALPAIKKTYYLKASSLSHPGFAQEQGEVVDAVAWREVR